MNSFDLLLAPFYIVILTLFFSMYRSHFLGSTPMRKFFMPGLLLKFFGAITAGLMYQFYYGTGDTFSYFDAAEQVNKLLDINFETWWESISSKAKGNILGYYCDVRVTRNDQTFFFVKICALIGLFTFTNYTCISLVMASFCFYCSWKFYKMTCFLFPHMYDTLGYCIFYIPSVVFWGSGLFKDTATFGCLLLFSVSFFNVFIRKYQVLKHIFLLVLSGWCIYNIRQFILLLIIGPSFLWYVLQFKDTIKNSKVKFFLGPVFIVVGLGLGVIGMAALTSADEQLQSANLVDKSKGFQSWHSADGAGGSSYTLGDMDYSTFGILKKMPLAINVSLFRPYLWEVTNPVMLIAALESLFFLYLFLGIIKAVRFRFFYHIFDNSHAFYFLIFGLIYAFVTGFNSYNFGALVRYKIPCMPYFLIGMYIIKDDIQQSVFMKQKERQEKADYEMAQKQRLKDSIREREELESNKN
jgi:hypothetical protein